jgi:hypothetical protein
MTVDELAHRIENLERENARLKRVALFAFVCVASLVAMAQRHPTHSLEAESLVLKDLSGKARVRLTTLIGGRPELAFLDDAERPYVTIAGGPEPLVTLSQPGDTTQRQITLTAANKLYGVSIYGPYRSTCSKVGCISAGISLINNGPAFSLFDDQGVEAASIQWNKSLGALVTLGGLNAKTEAVLAVESGGARLALTDSNGFQSVLGSNSLENETTGETHQTSAASLVMFGKDNKLIWKAP